MRGREWPEDLRADAIRIYRLDGPSAASRATSIPLGSIRRWVAEMGIAEEAARERAIKGVDAEAARQEAHRAWISESRMRTERTRVELQEMLWDRALEILLRMDDEQVVAVTDDGDVVTSPPKGRDLKDMAIAVGVLIDKGRLEGGEVTDRTEVITLSEVETAIRKLEAELAGGQ